MDVLLWKKYQEQNFEREATWLLSHPLQQSFSPFKVQIQVFGEHHLDFSLNRYKFYVSAWPDAVYCGSIDRGGLLTADEILVECVRLGEEAREYFDKLTIDPEPHHVLGEN